MDPGEHQGIKCSVWFSELHFCPWRQADSRVFAENVNIDYQGVRVFGLDI